MATLRQEFVDLAAELIGDEFADFAYDCALTTVTGWNNTTQAETSVTQTIPAIRMDFQSAEFDGEAIMVNDYMLIAERQPITIPIDPGATDCTFRGDTLDIIDTVVDSADATIIFHVRRK